MITHPWFYYSALFSALLLCIVPVAAPAEAPVTSDAPSLHFEKIIGDLRGYGMHNLSVAVGDDGTVALLMQEGRVALFGADGHYQRSIEVKLGWPVTYKYIAVRHRRILLGDYKQDYPWVFDPRRQGNAPGRFSRATQVVTDRTGRIYVADAGNKRIQGFVANHTDTPAEILKLSAVPEALAARGDELAVALGNHTLRLFSLPAMTPLAQGKIDPGVRAVALGPRGDVFAAYNAGPNHFQLKRYRRQGDKITETTTIAPSYTDRSPDDYLADSPMTTGPNGRIWFAGGTASPALFALDPKTDHVARVVSGVKYQPREIAFDQKGHAFVGGYIGGATPGPTLMVYDKPATHLALAGSGQGVAPADHAKARPFLKSGEPLITQSANVPDWGVLPAPDGSVYVRMIETGYRKGWPALTIKRLWPDGRTQPWLDFGFLYAKFTRFSPWEAVYDLEWTKDGNILLAALPLQAVLKATPDGKVLWRAGTDASGSADKIEFNSVRDMAQDSHGRIWIADADTDKIDCLSADGKLLYAYGQHADIDDTTGQGFDHPTAVAVAAVNGQDYLYVGDSGNQRIVKFRITELPKKSDH